MRKKSAAPTALVVASEATPAATTEVLLGDLRALIERSRDHVARAVNAGLVQLYWHVGRRIHTTLLGEARAPYGQQVVALLARRLTAEYGAGFSRTNLFAMVRFATLFPDAATVQTLSGQLGWSHVLELLGLDDPLAREFYAELCRVERWSVRTLRAKIQGLLFERTAVARKPAALARQELAALRDGDRLTPDLVFRERGAARRVGVAGGAPAADRRHRHTRER